MERWHVRTGVEEFQKVIAAGSEDMEDGGSAEEEVLEPEGSRHPAEVEEIFPPTVVLQLHLRGRLRVHRVSERSHRLVGGVGSLGHVRPGPGQLDQRVSLVGGAAQRKPAAL